MFLQSSSTVLRMSSNSSTVQYHTVTIRITLAFFSLVYFSILFFIFLLSLIFRQLCIPQNAFHIFRVYVTIMFIAVGLILITTLPTTTILTKKHNNSNNNNKHDVTSLYDNNCSINICVI